MDLENHPENENRPANSPLEAAPESGRDMASKAAGDWGVPRPEVLPRPTYAPAGLAFGATFLLWGILTSYIVSIVGGIIFVISLAAWIGEILHERGA